MTLQINVSLSAHLSSSRLIHCPVAYTQTWAWAWIWPSCHNWPRTERCQALVTLGRTPKLHLRSVWGWPRQDEQGAPPSRRGSPQREAAQCDTEHDRTASSGAKQLPSTTHPKRGRSLPASTSFPMAKRGERTEKGPQHPVSTFSQKLSRKAGIFVSGHVLRIHWKEGSSNGASGTQQHFGRERCLLLLTQG